MLVLAVDVGMRCGIRNRSMKFDVFKDLCLRYFACGMRSALKSV
jgi:hypothetical protein